MRKNNFYKYVNVVKRMKIEDISAIN